MSFKTPFSKSTFESNQRNTSESTVISHSNMKSKVSSNELIITSQESSEEGECSDWDTEEADMDEDDDGSSSSESFNDEIFQRIDVKQCRVPQSSLLTIEIHKKACTQNVASPFYLESSLSRTANHSSARWEDRHKMLADEITDELRKAVLQEREVARSTINAVHKRRGNTPNVDSSLQKCPHEIEGNTCRSRALSWKEGKG